MALASGARLGPYEIVSVLGAGGMGEVYGAKDTRLDRIVAIKVLPDGVTASPQTLERFHLETAARSLYRDLGLACDDARALVGLSEVGSCG